MNGTVHPLWERVATLPHKPGVYRYLDEGGGVLYVGKAKDLRKRVASYFSAPPATPRTAVMLLQARDLEVTVTATEIDALILEANLIKRHRPRYNVLLKDDKSYPYLHLSTGHPWPRLSLYRGDRREGGRFFGPYPSSSAVRQTLKWLQRLFPLRQCPDQQFASRQRPCLQYQIHRCGGPCREKVGREEYAAWVREVTLFLEGRERQLAEGLRKAMWAAAEAREFEGAAELRDRLKAIEHVCEKRKLNLTRSRDLDVVGLAAEGGTAAVQIFFVRGGVNLGNREFFPEHTEALAAEEVLEAFLAQFYADKSPPPEILVDRPLAEAGWLAAALGQRRGSVVTLRHPERGEKRQLVELAVTNARESLARRRAGAAAQLEVLESLAELLGMGEVPQRIETYDVSHLQDTFPVGSLVVFGPGGFRKGAYRRFALDDSRLADDTARMGAMLTRRFRQLRRAEELAEEGTGGTAKSGRKGEPGEGEAGEWPDLVLLDGGQGQLNAALRVAAELQLEGVTWCAIAKGPERRIGQERLFLPGTEEPLILPSNSPILFLLQQMRDEAHRFAVGYHRVRRHQEQSRSTLDAIGGIGPRRKRALLRHFGSVAAVRNAGIGELEQVEGISRQMAEVIHTHFRTHP